MIDSDIFIPERCFQRIANLRGFKTQFHTNFLFRFPSARNRKLVHSQQTVTVYRDNISRLHFSNTSSTKSTSISSSYRDDSCLKVPNHTSYVTFLLRLSRRRCAATFSLSQLASGVTKLLQFRRVSSASAFLLTALNHEPA